jgi:hypothetical protein
VVEHRTDLLHAILTHTGRQPDSTLFTNPDQTWRGANRPPLNVTCREFVEGVFDGVEDHVTHYLDEGIFKEMAAEEVHPAGSQLAASPKKGPVFELRNMVPPDFQELDHDRFPPDRWVALADFLASVLRRLHSRTDDTRVDVKYLGVNAFPEARRWYE